MKIFKKYSLVPTGNIKQYIIDEFTRANNLDKEKRELTKNNDELNKIINRKDEELQKASLIIEQLKYKSGKSKENYDNDIQEYGKRIDKLENQLKNEKEKSNTYQIKIIELTKQIDELKKQIKELKKPNKKKVKK